MFAEKFLSRYPADTVRSVDLSVQMSASLTDFYLAGLSGPSEDRAIITASTGAGDRDRSAVAVTARNNVWERLCATLAGLTRLRHLRVWVDSKDLRPWHKSACETRLFSTLAKARAADFELYLPTLPAQNRGLADSDYLQTDEERGPVSFKVRRGERIDKFLVHLNTRGPGTRAIGQEVPTPGTPHWAI